MPTATLILLCLLAGALFARQLFQLLRIAALLVGVAFAVRLVLWLLPELSAIDWSGSVLSVSVVAVVMLFGYRLIHNALVDADLRRQIERDKAQAAGRRI